MQFEVESPHSLRQFCPEPLGIRFSLESNDDVVCKSHDDDITVCVSSAPRLNPQVEDVVEVDVGQQRRCHSAYTKGNFQFERTVEGWRERYALLDMRRK